MVILRGPHELIHIVWDVSSHVKGSGEVVLPLSEKTARAASPNDISRVLIKSVIAEKILYCPSDRVSLDLVGTEDTSFELETKTNFKHIETVCEYGDGWSNVIEGIECLGELSTTTREGNLFNALIVAIESSSMYRADTKGVSKEAKIRILIFTDGEGCQFKDEGKGPTVATWTKEREISLSLIYVGREDLSGETSNFSDDLKEAIAFVELCREEENGKFDRCNLKLTDGSIVSALDLSQELIRPRQKRVTPTTKSRGAIAFGEALQFPCYIYLGVKEELFPSPKWESVYSKEDDKSQVTRNRSYYVKHADHAKDETNEIEEQEEVPLENRSRAYLYASQLIPVTSLDASVVAPDPSEKELSVIGTIYRDHYESFFLVRATEVVVAEPSNEIAYRGMVALAHSLRQTKRGLICRYIWRKNLAPKIVLLTPRLSEDSPNHLLLNYLPFEEDFKLNIPEASLPTPTRQQQDAMNSFVAETSLVLRVVKKNQSNEDDTIFEEEEKSLVELFQPKETFNPALQLFNFHCKHRLVQGKDAPLVKAPPILAEILKIPKTVLTTSDTLRDLQALFPTHKVSRRVEEKKLEWQDAQKAAEKIDIDEILGDAEGDMANEHVSVVDPLPSFLEKMGTDSINLRNRFMRELREILIDLTIESLRVPETTAKILSILSAMRKEAISRKVVAEYNACLLKLRDILVMDTRAFKSFALKLSQDESLGPISSMDVQDETVMSVADIERWRQSFAVFRSHGQSQQKVVDDALPPTTAETHDEDFDELE